MTHSNSLRVPCATEGCGVDCAPPNTVCNYCGTVERGRRRGWTYVDDTRCPRLLVGKRCLTELNEDGDLTLCWCSNRLNDHGNTWRDRNGVDFVLWEPYGAFGEELGRTIDAAHADGLSVWVGESVWNPPRTVAIKFKPEAARK